MEQEVRVVIRVLASRSRTDPTKLTMSLARILCAALPSFALGMVAVASTPVPIDALVAEIITQNPERSLYLAEIEAARVDERLSTRRADPELSLELGRTRVRDRTGALVGEGTAWAVSVTQSFAWPGRLALRKAIANRQVELAELGLARFERDLAAQARQFAFGLHAAHTQAIAVREVAERFAELRATLVARDPAGIAALLDLRVIEAADLELRRRATTAELAVQAALIDLNRLRGAALDAALRVEATPPHYPPAPVLSDLLRAARSHNFDYAMRRAELEQQGLQVDLARHEDRPGFSVSPFASSDHAAERETVVGIGLSLPLPINGRAALQVSAAATRQRQAEVALALALRDLERDVLTAAQTFTARLNDLPADPAATIAQFQEAAALADRHYRLGPIGIGTYVELQRSYLDALETLAENQADVLSAALALEALTHLTLVSPPPSS